MAPGLLVDDDAPGVPTWAGFNNENAPRDIFPDGLRTSGQHPPLYEALRPYSEFPKAITGPTVWSKDEFDGHLEKWTHYFTNDEIEELGEAADAFIKNSIPLVGITKENFPLPKLGKTLTPLHHDLLNGKGFVLFRKFPAHEWDLHKTSVAYMGLGAHLGRFISQNANGHVLGHVKDIVGQSDPARIDISTVRLYKTQARQFFHTDECDIVGLLCIQPALEGGESDIVSAHELWNTLQREHSDVAELLTEPIWYFDRKGETSRGQEEYTRQPIFYLENGGRGRVYLKWDPYFIRSLQRFSDKGIIPALSPEQERAAKILEETCNRLALHMILETGDIQFLSNAHLLHARTAYKNPLPPAPGRHLLRLWLATCEEEGGWVLPFADSKEKKRGGVQVDNTPPSASLIAE